MKRYLSVILLLIPLCAVMLTACRKPQPELKASFESEIIVSGEQEITAHLNRTPDALTIAVTSPMSIAGLTYTYSGGELTASLNGHRCITDTDTLPSGAFPAVLHMVLCDIERAEYLSSDDSGDTFTLSTPSGDVQVTLADGLPVRISGDHMNYTITTAA